MGEFSEAHAGVENRGRVEVEERKVEGNRWWALEGNLIDGSRRQGQGLEGREDIIPRRLQHSQMKRRESLD